MTDLDGDVRLLKRCIEESGLSARRFAVEVLLRDERTIRRWLAGDSPIPRVVTQFLEDPIGPPWPGPSVAQWVATRSEKWLHAIYRGDWAEVRPAMDPDHVGVWLSDFPVADELRSRTLDKLSQAVACLVARNAQGAASAILAIRRDWNCGPTGPPSLEDYIPTRLRHLLEDVPAG